MLPEERRAQGHRNQLHRSLQNWVLARNGHLSQMAKCSTSASGKTYVACFFPYPFFSLLAHLCYLSTLSYFVSLPFVLTILHEPNINHVTSATARNRARRNFVSSEWCNHVALCRLPSFLPPKTVVHEVSLASGPIHTQVSSGMRRVRICWHHVQTLSRHYTSILSCRNT